MITAILSATLVVGVMTYGIYELEKKTSRYTDGRMKFTMMAFEQSCWFVGAFYVTWVPYLTLQYMLSSGKGYNNFGLIISAATLVPLQGFWNSFVYIRVRYLSSIASRAHRISERISGTFENGGRRLSDMISGSFRHRRRSQIEVIDKEAD